MPGKITELLDAGLPLQDTDLIEVVQGVGATPTNRKVAVSELGGGGVPPYRAHLEEPLDAPVAAYEFNESLLLNEVPAGCTKVLPSGTCDHKVDRGVLSLLFNAQTASHFGGFLWQLPAGLAFPYAVEVAYRHQSFNVDFLMAGAVFTNGVANTSDLVWAMMHDTPNVRNLGGRSGTITNVATTYGQQTERASRPGWYMERLVAKAANTWQVQMSLDGVLWNTVTADFSFTMTPTHFGCGFSTWGGNNSPWRRNISYDYVRLYQL